jgi:hypothetical protein
LCQFVHQAKIQDGYKLTPLSQWGKGKVEVTSDFKVNPKIDMKTPPLDQVNNMSSEEFFKLAAEPFKVNPPHATDWMAVGIQLQLKKLLRKVIIKKF